MGCLSLRRFTESGNGNVGNIIRFFFSRHRHDSIYMYKALLGQFSGGRDNFVEYHVLNVTI